MTAVSTSPLSEIADQRRSDAARGEYNRIRVDTVDRVATVTIDRPEVLNCFDYLTLLELHDAFHDLGRDTGVDVVVLTGAGERAFCTGADLREQQALMIANPHDYYTWMGAFIDVHERLRNIGKPTVARLNGITVGGGNEFNLACDLSVIVEDAYIRHVGPAHGSVPAGGATQWLTIFSGDRRAREILLLGDPIDAHTAHEWGLVNRVVSRDSLDTTVAELVTRLQQTLPETVRYARTQTNFWKDLAWYQTIHHARDWLTLHTNAPEVRSAVEGFVTKSPPDYEAIRARWGTPAGAYAWGAPTATCASCGATGLPTGFSHCGSCGAALPQQS